MKKILIVVDHKHRDLASLSHIGYHLEKRGFEVSYCAVWKETHKIKNFCPDVVVLPKPIYRNYSVAEWRLSKKRIVVVDVEGNLQSKNFGFLAPKIYPDLYFYWNDIFFKKQQDHFTRYQNHLSGEIPKMMILGCPRIDFHHESFKKYFEPKDKILSRLKLSNKKKIITISTVSGNADMSLKDRELMQSKLNLRNTNPYNFHMQANNCLKLREITIELIKELATSKNLQIVIKPHPNENPEFWEKSIKKNNFNFVRIMKGEPIESLLNISDVHISHNVCTTTFEAMLRGIPALEIQTKSSKSLYAKKDLDLPLYSSDSSNKLARKTFEILDDYKNHSTLSSKKGEIFCKKYYGDFDGKRCETYAEKIAVFSQMPFREINFLEKFHLIALIVHEKLIVPNLIRIRNFSIQNSIQRIKEIFSSKTIEDSYSRYDKDYAEGDEKYWYEKFKQ